MSSIVNVSSTPLVADASYTGSFERVGPNYFTINIMIYTDAGKDGSLAVQWSSNGSNVDLTDTITHSGGGLWKQLPIKAEYVKLVYVNGGTDQTDFRLDVHYLKGTTSELAVSLSSAEDSVAAVQSGTWNVNSTIQNASLAVTASSLPLPSGAATESTLSAVQTAVEGTLTVNSTVQNASLATTNAILDIVDFSTSAKQDSGNSSLADIKTAVEGTLTVNSTVQNASLATTNAILDIVDFSTSANQSTANGHLSTIAGDTTSLDSKIPSGLTVTSGLLQVGFDQTPASLYRNLDIDESGVSAYASAGSIRSITAFNNVGFDRYVKVYDKATTPTVGSDSPIMTIPVRANSHIHLDFSSPIAFASGLGFGCTTGIADSDTGAPSTGDIVLMVSYA